VPGTHVDIGQRLDVNRRQEHQRRLIWSRCWKTIPDRDCSLSLRRPFSSGKDFRKFLQPKFDPCFTVIRAFAEQKRTSHTTRDAVVPTSHGRTECAGDIRSQAPPYAHTLRSSDPYPRNTLSCARAESPRSSIAALRSDIDSGLSGQNFRI
jgi:hypothetical protein